MPPGRLAQILEPIAVNGLGSLRGIPRRLTTLDPGTGPTWRGVWGNVVGATTRSRVTSHDAEDADMEVVAASAAVLTSGKLAPAGTWHGYRFGNTYTLCRVYPLNELSRFPLEPFPPAPATHDVCPDCLDAI